MKKKTDLQKKKGSIRNFNISVGLTNSFMERVKSNDPRPWLCEFGGKTYPLRRITRDGDRYTQYKIEEVTMTARELFQEILKAAHRNGEPGCVFLDRVNDTNPLPHLGRIESSNPCGEQFLHDGDVPARTDSRSSLTVIDSRSAIWARSTCLPWCSLPESSP